MTPEKLQQLKAMLRKLWVMSPEKLWLGSIALRRKDHWVLAFWLKQLGGLVYHNSLAPGASVSPDVFLGHNGLGVVVGPNVEIGRRVTIWHNVTLIAGARPGQAERDKGSRIVVEDGVKIGAGAVIIAARGSTLRVGRNARVGAGTVVTEDVPAGATIVGAAPRLLATHANAASAGGTQADAGGAQGAQANLGGAAETNVASALGAQ
jgi:serine O-acetyltransferase